MEHKLADRFSPLSMLEDTDRLYRALIERDAGFEGLFVVGVTTTGIFCRPTCPARKPKREHVLFFASGGEALLHGFRPCKVCRPLAPHGAFPDWLAPLMDELADDPAARVHDRELRERGIDPARVRRWFKRHHDMTFQAYLRALRIGHAYGRIAAGDSVTGAAFESGYDSLSGFAHSFRRSVGFSPVESGQHSIATIARIPTPLGPMLAGAVESGLCLLEFTDRRMIEAQIDRVRRLLGVKVLPGMSRFFGPLREQLDAYFAGRLHRFDLPLVASGTPFQRRVWRELCAIPYGETRSYSDQAARIGKPEAVRAVARANGDNRIAILIPCHRVVGKNGALTGYGGGLARKRYLLELENRYAPDGSRAGPTL